MSLLVTSCAFGLVLGSGSLTSLRQPGEGTLTTNALVISTQWCNDALTECYDDTGPCTADECMHCWLVYAPEGVSGVPILVQPSSPLPLSFFSTNPLAHNEQGRWCGPADIDLDGVLSSADLFTFLNQFFTLSPSADFDLSGSVDSSDLFTFLNAFLST